MLCWQNLTKQVVEQADFLRRTGEDLQLTADQALQLEKMAALEKSSREQSEKGFWRTSSKLWSRTILL